MKRPDQDRFDQHSQHFAIIDSELERFCSEHGFRLETNLYHTPCRALRRAGNPELVFEIYQQGDWLKLEYREDLPHTLAVASYYEPPDRPELIFRLTATLAENEPFFALRLNLEKYLNQGLALLESWLPEIIVQQGKGSENFKKKYN